jgi:enoyl-CoA hydratase/carnithine racemase
VEEFFLHLWDDFDDIAGVCRHVTTAVAAEFVAAAAPVIAAVAGSVLAGAATLLLSHRPLLSLLA